MTDRSGRILLTMLLSLGVGCLSPQDAVVIDGPDADQEEDLNDKGLTSGNGLKSMNGLMPFNGMRTLNGLSAVNGLSATNGNLAYNGNSALNGMWAWNGLQSTNGLQSVNGLRVNNGLTAFNGLNSRNGLQASANLVSDLIAQGGGHNAEYVVKCALRPDQSAYGYPGLLGVCPEYATESIAQNPVCQEKISSCLMALTNYHGDHVQVELRSPIPSIGTAPTGQAYTIQEGRYFGNFWGANPRGYFCVNRKYAGSSWGDYMAVPRMCEYTDGTWNGDFWSGGTPANNWMMDKCAYAIVGICEDICEGWSCTYGGKTYDNPIEVWRWGGSNSYSTPKVNRNFVLHYGGMPVVPSRCVDDTKYETHGRPSGGGYRSCADFTDRACEDVSNVWGQSAIQTWEAKHKCPRACKASRTCSVLYEAEHATAQSACVPKGDQAGASASAYVAYGSRGFLAFDNVIVSQAANYEIAVRYNTAGKAKARLELWVNGEARGVASLFKVNKGSWLEYKWTTQLAGGQNTVELRDVGTDRPNVDSMTVAPVDFSTSTGTVVLHKTRLAGENASIASHTFQVPYGARGVNVSVYNDGYDATPDLDLFVRRGSEPSTSYGPDLCGSIFAGEEGRPCSFSSVDQELGGTWYVKIKGWGAYGGGSGEGWELKATYY